MMISSPEQNILIFLKAFVAEHGFSPTLTEIKEGIGYKSRGAAYRYVCQLVDKGLLINQKNEKRGLRLPQSNYLIPMQGRIAAGSPIEAVAESERLSFHDRINIAGLYQLQIKGDSMVNVGIDDGDIVLIKPSRTANNGQIVVALIDSNEATLKRFYKRKAYIELRAENDDYPLQRYQPDRVEIQGILHSVHKFSF